MNLRIEGNFDKIQEMCKFYQNHNFKDENGKIDLCYYAKNNTKDIRECDALECPFVNLIQEDDLK